MDWSRGGLVLALCWLVGCAEPTEDATTATVGSPSGNATDASDASTTTLTGGNAPTVDSLDNESLNATQSTSVVTTATAAASATDPAPQLPSPTAAPLAALAAPVLTVAPATLPLPLYDLSSAPTCATTITLRLGDVGAEVRCLQTRLDQIASAGEVVVDGTFGASTDDQVRLFQAVNSLSVDGVVGPQTAGLLNIWAEPPSPTTVPPAIQPAIAPVPDAFYENCDAARAAGAAPINRGEPGYRSKLDRDDDGVACE